MEPTLLIEKMAALLLDMIFCCDAESLKEEARVLIKEAGYTKHEEWTDKNGRVRKMGKQVEETEEKKEVAVVGQPLNIAELRAHGIKYAPNSSNIELCVYAPYERVLLIDFKGGSSYIYHGFTEEQWSELTRAESAGRYFQSKIRNVNECAKVVKDSEGKESIGS